MKRWYGIIGWQKCGRIFHIEEHCDKKYLMKLIEWFQKEYNLTTIKYFKMGKSYWKHF